MTVDEWVAVNLAAAPPLTSAQIAALRPLLRPAVTPGNRHGPRANGGRVTSTHQQQPEQEVTSD